MANPLRILMLNHHITWRGAFTRCYQFARRMVQLGCQVTIITISPTNRFWGHQFTLEGITIIESPDLLWGLLRSGWDPWDTVYRSFLLKHDKKYDIIHGFDSRPAVILPALVYRWHHGGNLISDWGDWWGRGGVIRDRPHKVLNRLIEPIETFFEEYFRNKADAMVTVSEALRKRAVALGVPSEIIRVISNGCDTDDIKLIDKIQARVRLGLAADAKVVAFSGFTTYEFDFLIRAFTAVCKEIPNAILLVTGSKFVNAHEIPEFANNGRILETGMVPRKDLGAYLSCADVCLLPLKDNLANTARSPGKLWDYLATGRPIVSNEVGEAGDLLRHERVGLLSEYDPDDFARQISFLLKNPGQAEDMGRRARSLAETKYSWNIKTKELLSFYQLLCSK